MSQHVFFMPHPPIIMKEIGRGDERKASATVAGMQSIATEIEKIKPDVVIFVSPHGNAFKNGVSILYEKLIEGDFSTFGYPSIGFTKFCDLELSKLIGEIMDGEDINNIYLDTKLCQAYHCDMQLDHGAMVPMYFIDQLYSDYEIVHLTPGFTTIEEQYSIGQAIAKAAQLSNKKVVVIASGDLSHCLLDSGPYKYNPQGAIFDELVVNALKSADPLQLIGIDPDIFEPAGQCGLRSFIIGMGFLDKFKKTSTVYSYEGPFGVGYVTASIVGSKTEASLLDMIKQQTKEIYEMRIKNEDDYIKVARAAINQYVTNYEKLNVQNLQLADTFLKKAVKQKAGVFVSIHKDGKLRGCIGTITPVYDHIIDEIIYNAISACSKDPRFNVVEERELYDLEVKVDILGPSEIVYDRTTLDCKKYGVIVEKGYKRGVLLPNLEGVNSVEEQLSIVLKKADIDPDETDYNLYRFIVERHE